MPQRYRTIFNKSWLFSIMFFTSQVIYGQFGVNGIHQLESNAEDWEVAYFGTESFQSTGVGVGIDYWLRLKNYRVEFLSELGYIFGEKTIIAIDDVVNTLSWSQFQIVLNTNIYVFDIEGDCNCPTWGKEGGFFKKGFYLQAGLGVVNLTTDNSNVNATTSGGSDLAPTFHGGLGLDIGIGKYLTMTPWLRYTYKLPLEWKGIGEDGNISDEVDGIESSSTALQLGLRIGYRFDYKNR